MAYLIVHKVVTTIFYVNYQEIMCLVCFQLIIFWKQIYMNFHIQTKRAFSHTLNSGSIILAGTEKII